MIRAAAALLLTAAAIAPSPAFAQSIAATATIDPARRALGLELARLLNPEAPIMAALEKLFDTALPAAMLADSDMKEMEAQYPGLADAMTKAMKPILLRYLRTQLPEMWNEIGSLFGEMSEADLRAAIAFYRTPTGARIIALMTDGGELGQAALTDLMTNQSDVAAVSSATRSMAERSIERLTPAERAEVMRFAGTPAGRRVAGLSPRVMKIVADWSTKPAPEVEAELQAAIMPVIEHYTGIKLK